MKKVDEKIDLTKYMQPEVANLIETCEKNGFEWTYKKIKGVWWFMIDKGETTENVNNGNNRN